MRLSSSADFDSPFPPPSRAQVSIFCVERSDGGCSWLLLVPGVIRRASGVTWAARLKRAKGREGGREGAFNRGEWVDDERSCCREGWIRFQWSMMDCGWNKFY